MSGFGCVYVCLCMFRGARTLGLCRADPVHVWEPSAVVCTHRREQWGPVRGAVGRAEGARLVLGRLQYPHKPVPLGEGLGLSLVCSEPGP